MQSIHNLNHDPMVSYRANHKYLGIFGMIWISFMILTVFTSTKTFDLFGFTFVAAAIAYPITYIFSDIFTEIYGYRVSRRIVWSGLFCLLTITTFAFLYTYIPASSTSDKFQNNAYNLIFRTSPIIALATLIAFSAGEFTNSFIIAKLKILTKGKYVELRYLASTFFGQIIDNSTTVAILLIFTDIFTVSVGLELIVTTVIFCTLWELLMTPITKRFIKWIKIKEGLDTYDHGTNFNPMKFG